MKFTNEAVRKTFKYEYDRQYTDRKTALRISFWAFFYGLFFREKKIATRHCSGALKIAFWFDFGLGDIVLAMNYLSYFRRFLDQHLGKSDDSYQLDCYTPARKIQMVREITGEELAPSEQLDQSSYDLVMVLGRRPKILRFDKDRIQKRSKALASLVQSYLTAQNFLLRANPHFYEHPCTFVWLKRQILLGRRRVQEGDIDSTLGIGRETTIHIPSIPEKKDILEKFSLPEKFITINRGVDPTNTSSEHTKLWPIDFYNRLIALLHEAFPELYIVQTGVSLNASFKLDGVNRSLVGQTTITDMKGILKYSALHIDDEGGMVHLRHAVKGGPSVVLFGPTPMEYYKYDENLNLRSSCCDWCEWVTSDWATRCPKTGGAALCMKELKPETVFEEIRMFIDLSSLSQTVSQ